MASELLDVALALQTIDDAAGELRAVRDRLATLLYAAEMQRQWIVPSSHRPTCPLDQKPCTSWTCLLDVCVDAKKDGSLAVGGEGSRG